MWTIHIEDFDDWRSTARKLIGNQVAPSEVQLFDQDGQQSLFEDSPDLGDRSASTFRVSREFVSLAQAVSYHRDFNRWNLLYRTLWRIKNGQPHLLEIETDADVHRLIQMEKQVRRDAHKMKAFVRFRKVERDGEEYFIAWHQPDHRIVRRVAPFFSRRFRGMNWGILTPDESVTWDQSELHFGPGVTRSDAPGFDELEDLWRIYYANIFNPARVKVKMMKSEMPVRYWKNLPEADIIADLLTDAPRRVEQMIQQHEGFDQTAIDFIKQTEGEAFNLTVLKEMAAECTACDLCRDATQTVFGTGPVEAKVVLLGEQPGDQEDIAGEPFVGPAGKVLDEAIAKAGLDRDKMYLTNVVKHFKHTQPDAEAIPNKKKRLHQKPNAREVRCCRPWFDAEWSCLENAEILICLGETAARAIVGPGHKISEIRGHLIETDYCPRTIVTWHPAAILRSPSEDHRLQKMRELIKDLSLAGV
ncbi:UdgX family uracil-DNA binding protein [Mariniblastus sp.]|nr:UdgX family uracil-DNA binding protein [Mariniblastus sp.]MDA7902315.1 UdgX family uracil-DNA binding protein [Mariniblastus sp.]MDC0294166.1 UdgX family uracil-DNA binding protein [Mariniblastus sp.]